MIKALTLIALIALAGCATTYAGGDPVYEDTIYD